VQNEFARRSLERVCSQAVKSAEVTAEMVTSSLVPRQEGSRKAAERIRREAYGSLKVGGPASLRGVFSRAIVSAATRSALVRFRPKRSRTESAACAWGGDLSDRFDDTSLLVDTGEEAAVPGDGRRKGGSTNSEWSDGVRSC
jgi:hypothetical protein